MEPDVHERLLAIVTNAADDAADTISECAMVLALLRLHEPAQADGDRPAGCACCGPESSWPCRTVRVIARRWLSRGRPG